MSQDEPMNALTCHLLFPFSFGPDSLVYSITSLEVVSKVGRNEFEWGMVEKVKNKLMLVKVVETSNCFLQ